MVGDGDGRARVDDTVSGTAPTKGDEGTGATSCVGLNPPLIVPVTEAVGEDAETEVDDGGWWKWGVT